MAFIEKQSHNTRNSTGKKAEKLLKKPATIHRLL
jgi:hypothetical protein